MNAQTELTTKQSRSQLKIEPRRVRFDYESIDRADFFDENIVSSAYYAALSVSFPPGEAEFIKSVRHFEKQITDPQLQAEVKDFAAQEAHHGLQHKRLNQQLARIGYEVSELERAIDEKLTDRVDQWSPAKRLRRTVAAEHFTATMAHHALTHPDTLNPGPEVFKNLMLWHAIEEVEHKSVAFDVYQHCVGDMNALRLHYLHFLCIEFPLQYWLMTRFLLKQGGYKVTWKDRRRFLAMLFGKRGMFSSVIGLYLKFLVPGFHPWKTNDARLVGQWKETLSPYFLTAAENQV